MALRSRASFELNTGGSFTDLSVTYRDPVAAAVQHTHGSVPPSMLLQALKSREQVFVKKQSSLLIHHTQNSVKTFGSAEKKSGLDKEEAENKHHKAYTSYQDNDVYTPGGANVLNKMLLQFLHDDLNTVHAKHIFFHADYTLAAPAAIWHHIWDLQCVKLFGHAETNTVKCDIHPRLSSCLREDLD